MAIVLLLMLALAACQGNQTQAPAAEATAAQAQTAETATETATEAAATATEAAAATPSTETDTAASAPAAAPAADTALQFQIVPEGTEARFLVGEILMGQPKTVVGATSQVTGDITVDPANPAGAQIGEIRVDASTLATDDNRRNGRLHDNILKSSSAQYQYIVFKPTAVSGMPAGVSVGQPFTFQVTGDLTILDMTAPVTFDMTVNPVSTGELQGSGKATVRYADFGISIPSVPMVAGVDEQVQLEIDFTAKAAS
ncbi:MAG: YceI family protein [Caldilineaceae bacterium]